MGKMADFPFGFLVVYFADRAGFWRCVKQAWRGSNFVAFDWHRP
jgi:hypothetical protein